MKEGILFEELNAGSTQTQRLTEFKRVISGDKGKPASGKSNSESKRDAATLPYDEETISLIFREVPDSSTISEDERTQIARVLENVYFLAECDQPRLAAARIMDYLDDWQLSGAFTTCDHFLKLVDVARLKKSPTTLVALLGITVAAKSKLPARDRLYSRAMQVLAESLGPDRAASILGRFQ